MATYIRRIDFGEIEDDGGLGYDLDRARREGLYELVEFPDVHSEEATPDRFFELAHEMEASVNVPPAYDTHLDTPLGHIRYRYGYGPTVDA
jgi:hypothetical protein